MFAGLFTTLVFFARIVLAWFGAFFLVGLCWSALPFVGSYDPWALVVGGVLVLPFVVTSVVSHLRRVRLIAGRIDRATLNNRQRRQVEVPFEAGEAFDLLDAAIRELPRVQQVESARDSLQVRAKITRIECMHLEFRDSD